MSARRPTARTVAQLVGIGQRWARRRDGMVMVIYQVHRGDRSAEAHFEGDDPRVAHTRFQLGFGELAAKYELLDTPGLEAT
jgi:hypothetical protein